MGSSLSVGAKNKESGLYTIRQLTSFACNARHDVSVFREFAIERERDFFLVDVVEIAVWNFYSFKFCESRCMLETKTFGARLVLELLKQIG